MVEETPTGKARLTEALRELLDRVEILDNMQVPIILFKGLLSPDVLRSQLSARDILERLEKENLRHRNFPHLAARLLCPGRSQWYLTLRETYPRALHQRKVEPPLSRESNATWGM